ncbi:hypothetical protein CC80DRAFT_493343 [Byssothecium circinans]|uniref:DUF7053 domain-containing protein n=1 Tax=Byssothecium circinans TaxID=147558 RepID=A0A6A5U181_9PLEO|nr:hypothetical protein CC80DRAFT_493343 [Byssothecium circinans]
MTTTSVSTALPSGLPKETVIAALHNHELMIKTLCPELISYEFESGDKDSQATYSVTDKKPIGQTTYKLTLTNVPTGVDSLVNAKPPVGTLTISGKWRVDDHTLVEDVEIEGNFVMKKMAKGNVEKTHPEQHVKLLQQVTA